MGHKGHRGYQGHRGHQGYQGHCGHQGHVPKMKTNYATMCKKGTFGIGRLSKVSANIFSKK